ncbi:copper ion binding protein [Paenibacillus sp. YYML68]|uniref:copper ion binding protein n=1 Tax=Paenibacillus sp. YYML68 TaxID=2909250 RepID=UPI0024930860|nr:copper ion binding protein [Paenibacillus sp. YYML68]
MATITLQVEGMSCNHCVNSIEGTLRELGALGQVNLAAQTVTVEYDESKLQVETIKSAIEEQGYDVK